MDVQNCMSHHAVLRIVAKSTIVIIGIGKQDVICLMISYIDERGFLYVKPSGGIDVSILQARKVVIVHENKEILGVIGKNRFIFYEKNRIIKLLLIIYGLI